MQAGILMMMALALSGVLGLALACGRGAPSEGVSGTKVSGVIEIDGSSTVFPITEAMAEEFRLVHRDVRTNVGVSGTGGGFKRFVAGETDISNASRPISASEADVAKLNSVEYVELQVAIDGLAVMVNRRNTFANCLTTTELKRVWEPGSQVRSWRDVRPDFPDQPLRLYGPGTDSGTFDYFTEAINGKAKASRADFTASEDDNVLVQGISGDRNALGYFGYAYYTENEGLLKLVSIEGGKGCVEPNEETIRGYSYVLSRPLLIYVNTKKLAERPELQAFVKFYLENAGALAKEVGYVSLEASAYQAEMDKVAAFIK